MLRVSSRTNRQRRALTLIEVLIVIAVLLAIGGLVVVNLLPQKEQADIDLTSVDIKTLYTGLDDFKRQTARYPSEEEGLRVLWDVNAVETDDEDGESRYKTAYLRDPKPRDAWGNEWVYRYPGEIRGESYPDIISLGPDGEEGTDDDITNHDAMLTDDGELDEEFDIDVPDVDP